MARQLKISIGQHTDKGRKEINQDFHGALIPKEPVLSAKGIAIALADGISTSNVSQIAAESAVKGFLTDYYCTSDAWSVKMSAQRVLAATNSWLHSQTRQSQHRYEKDKGYVCTLSAMVIKSTSAHLFHVGDSRIYRVNGKTLEVLTEDHRLIASSEQSYLTRAMGINHQIEIDYRTLKIEAGDTFLLATDGVYEYFDAAFVTTTIIAHGNDLDRAAKVIVDDAFRRRSGDNLTLQIIRIDELPDAKANEVLQQISELPLPPLLEARMLFDGYKIEREVHATSRSHIYLATDLKTGALAILKVPSIDLRGDPAYLKRFMMEEWIGRRLNNAHVLKAAPQDRKRKYLYVVTEFIDGQTLTQWMIDNPRPDLETVRGIVEQIGKGLRAFHRRDMLHQDLRPENVMIDKTGTAKIIDFGSTRVAGVTETEENHEQNEILGTVQYTAPEYFLGEGGSSRSDLFSLGVITYQMLTGNLPYGAEVARTKTKSAMRKLRYQSALRDDRDLPAWIDEVLKKAVHVDPTRRYDEVSEFMFELRTPNPAFLQISSKPMMERNPFLFWKLLSLGLAATVVLLLWRLNQLPH